MSVHKRGKTWTAVVDLGKDEITGKRKQVTKGGFKKKKEAEDFETETRKQLIDGTFMEEKEVLLNDFIDDWLELKRKKLSPKTFEQYEYFARIHYKPYFKNKKLNAIKLKQIEEYINSKIDTISSTTINTQIRVLSQIFKYAIKTGYIQKNPVEFADRPKKTKPKIDTWNKEQAFAALEYYRDTPYYTHVLIALFCGLRLGEICGLREKDIDFENNIINVNMTVQMLAGSKLNFKEPKTEESKAPVVMPQIVADAIKEQIHKNKLNKVLYGEKYTNEFAGYILLWDDGNIKNPKYVSKRFCELLKQQEKLPKIKFHALRHTCASLMLASGADIKRIQEQLRHTRISITADLYTHVKTDVKRKAMDDFVKYMNN